MEYEYTQMEEACYKNTNEAVVFYYRSKLEGIVSEHCAAPIESLRVFFSNFSDEFEPEVEGYSDYCIKTSKVRLANSWALDFINYLAGLTGTILPDVNHGKRRLLFALLCIDILAPEINTLPCTLEFYSKTEKKMGSIPVLPGDESKILKVYEKDTNTIMNIYKSRFFCVQEYLNRINKVNYI